MMPCLPPDTESLVSRVAEGDALAAAELLHRHRGRLRRMIAMRIDRRIASRMDPSDIVQDALKAAHQRLPEYAAAPQVPFYPWLRRIACDRLADAYRTHIGAQSRSVLKKHAISPEVKDDSVAELAHCVASTSILPSRRAMSDELNARMVTALNALSPHDREILVLRYLEQLSVAEIAAALGITATAVTSRHLRALKRLRRLMRLDNTAAPLWRLNASPTAPQKAPVLIPST